MIAPKDISFVVHGPVDVAFTKNCIVSIRQQFGPDCEIILSTWPGAVLDFVYDYNVLLQSEDPGVNPYGPDTFRNVNRHIVSTLEGCKVATRKYICKVRSDLQFLHSGILRWHELWDRRSPKYKLYEERVSACNLYTLRSNDQPCYVTDFVFFGQRFDIIKMFSLPFMGKGNNLGPEQYIATTPFRLKWPELPELFPANLSDHIIGNNYQILDGQRQFGIICQKYPHFKDNWHETMMTHMEWVDIYYKTINHKLGV